MRVISYARLAAEKGIGYTPEHLRRLVKAGKFPAPIQLGAGRVGFLERDIDHWLATRPRVKPEVAETSIT